MATSRRSNTMSPLARSVFAIVDGILLFLALQGIFYAVAFLGLHRSFDTPTIPYLTINLVWAIVSALLAGYTAGRVAHRAPVFHGFLAALPFLAIGMFNLAKGVGGRGTAFVIGYNTLVPIAFLLGAAEVARRLSNVRALPDRD